MVGFKCEVGHCIMDDVQFEFNDIVLLYKKKDSEQDGQPAYDVNNN